MNGIVKTIYSAKQAGAELVEIESAQLVVGKGLVGDRYYHSIGTFSESLKESNDFQLTLIELEEIEAFNELSGLDCEPREFRRNLITKNVRLNELVGKEFSIGSVRIKGVRLCEPCAYLAKLLGDEIMQYMVHKAGLRAHVISNGTVNQNDSVIL